MLYILIGSAIIVGMLIGLTTLSVIWLAERVNKSLRDKTIELLTDYDEMLEKKSQDLAELENKLNSETVLKNEDTVIKQPTIKEQDNKAEYNIINAVQKVGSTTYRDSEIFELYRRIKNSFKASPENVEFALEKLPKSNDENPARDLLKIIPYSTIYELSTLESSLQEKLLRESLNGKYLKLLEEYKQQNLIFSVVQFYDYLKEKSDENIKPILFISSDDMNRKYRKDIEIELDDNICEGFIIKYKNVIYDYSIKENELK